MKKVELLSPAGNYECMIAAVQAGCNAVYLSGKAFGARSFAGNFDNDELVKAVEYCHLHQVKVYVTVNTIVLESEFLELDKYLSFLDQINVDAVIVQDLGVLRFIKKNYPNLEVHASTQMNIFNKEGALVLKELGVSRVVLSREASLSEVQEICDLGIETEIFIHGALCFSSSGNCLLSSVIGRRSGNRGKCAQPCRKAYQIYEDDVAIGQSKSILSMKDLMTLQYLDEILSTNITSLKIEGRMKSPEYVYSVTKAYHDAICEYYKHQKYVISTKTYENILVTFNRSFTKGYLLNEKNKLVVNANFVNHQGIEVGKIIDRSNDYIIVKLNHDISLHDGLRVLSTEEYGIYLTSIYVNNNNVKYASKNQIVKLLIKNNSKVNDVVVKTSSSMLSSKIKEILTNENIKFKIDLEVLIFNGKRLCVKTTIDDYSFNVYGETAIYSDKVLSEERIKEQLAKLTSTVYEIGNIKIKTDHCSFIKISALNELRRSFVLELNNYLLTKKNKVNHSYLPNFDNSFFIKDAFKIDCITTLDYQEALCKSFKIGRVFALNKELGARIKTFKSILTHNLGNLTKDSCISPYFNIVNRNALMLIKELGINDCYLSPEIDIETIKQLKLNELKMNVGIVAYGRIDLMVSKHCVIAHAKNALDKKCNACDKHTYKIKDEYGNYYPLVLEKDHDCTMRLLDNHKLNLINYLNELKQAGINQILLIFTDETEEQTQEILNMFINNQKITKKLYTGFINDKII